MVHLVTGDIISSNKKAIRDPSIAELWKTAFGKEFGGLAQGDIKKKTGTNATFVMSTRISMHTEENTLTHAFS